MNARPKMSTREKAEENRLGILEAAEKVFAQKGFDGANMREIAATAGVNKFMLYYHFEDKQTLFERVLDTITGPIFRRLSDTIDQAPDLETAVAAVFDLYAGLFRRKGGRLRAFMAREIAAGAPRVSKVFKIKAPEIMAHWKPKIEMFLDRDDIPPEQMAFCVMSIMTGIVSTFLLQPLFAPLFDSLGLDDEHLKDHVVAQILQGLNANRRATETNP
ncbi:MAG: TetR/AcrR family transcriptional regulator [Candidatus Neomarinimicrobiota bacterium]